MTSIPTNRKSSTSDTDMRALVITPCGVSEHGIVTTGTVVNRLERNGITVVRVGLDRARLTLFSDPHFGQVFMIAERVSDKHREVIDLLSQQHRENRLIFVPHVGNSAR